MEAHPFGSEPWNVVRDAAPSRRAAQLSRYPTISALGARAADSAAAVPDPLIQGSICRVCWPIGGAKSRDVTLLLDAGVRRQTSEPDVAARRSSRLPRRMPSLARAGVGSRRVPP